MSIPNLITRAVITCYEILYYYLRFKKDRMYKKKHEVVFKDFENVSQNMNLKCCICFIVS